jgi:hypothetical protein
MNGINENIFVIFCSESTFFRKITKKGVDVDEVDLSEKQIENAQK